ncbi:hypothetical protein DESPIG_02061 [Desulfovibrio piger ATCC 29098]|uniref:Uncharacterized protein n=1 Tax=Desulfovibrio piger ATCC 29098 TaxID=411464 RepID=B6WVE5_9BACT|nr:hypothetical protein DESPIG_02061 [Desulfovibrio piger ATCC 29098]
MPSKKGESASRRGNGVAQNAPVHQYMPQRAEGPPGGPSAGPKRRRI